MLRENERRALRSFSLGVKKWREGIAAKRRQLETPYKDAVRLLAHHFDPEFFGLQADAEQPKGAEYWERLRHDTLAALERNDFELRSYAKQLAPKGPAVELPALGDFEHPLPLSPAEIVAFIDAMAMHWNGIWTQLTNATSLLSRDEVDAHFEKAARDCYSQAFEALLRLQCFAPSLLNFPCDITPRSGVARIRAWCAEAVRGEPRPSPTTVPQLVGLLGRYIEGWNDRSMIWEDAGSWEEFDEQTIEQASNIERVVVALGFRLEPIGPAPTLRKLYRATDELRRKLLALISNHQPLAELINRLLETVRNSRSGHECVDGTFWQIVNKMMLHLRPPVWRTLMDSGSLVSLEYCDFNGTRVWRVVIPEPLATYRGFRQGERDDLVAALVAWKTALIIGPGEHSAADSVAAGPGTPPDGPVLPNQLYRDGRSVEIQPIPCALLNYLWKCVGKKDTKERVMEAVWGDDDQREKALDRAQHKANKSLLKAGYVLTIRAKSGYVSIE